MSTTPVLAEFVIGPRVLDSNQLYFDLASLLRKYEEGGLTTWHDHLAALEYTKWQITHRAPELEAEDAEDDENE